MSFISKHENKILAGALLVPVVLQLLSMLSPGLLVSPFVRFWEIKFEWLTLLFVLFAAVGFPIKVVGMVLAGGVSIEAFSALPAIYFDPFTSMRHALAWSGFVALGVLPFLDRAIAKRMTWGVIPILFTSLVAPSGLTLGRKLFSHWAWDGVLYNMESNLLAGEVAYIHFSEWVKTGHWWAYHVLGITYNTLTLVMALMVGMAVRYDYKAVSVPVFLIVSGLCAGLAYGLMPVIGPNATIDSMLAATNGLGSAIPFGRLETTGDYVKNGMPSLHFGWTFALMLISYKLPNRWLQGFMTVFCILTAFATLGTGEHYIVDLVVGTPFILAILAVMEGRYQVAKMFLLLVVLWYAGIMLNLVPRLPASGIWTLYVATVAGCIYLYLKAQEQGYSKPTETVVAPVALIPVGVQ